MHDRRDRIEERQRLLAGQRADQIGERGRGEGAGRDDDVVPLRRQRGDFLAADFDQRMRRERLRDGRRKSVAIDRQRAARRHLIGRRRRASPASRAGAFPRAAGRRHCSCCRRSETNSSRPVRQARRSCAPRVVRAGRISCSTTGTPRAAICQAASRARKPAADDVNRLHSRDCHGHYLGRRQRAATALSGLKSQ